MNRLGIAVVVMAAGVLGAPRAAQADHQDGYGYGRGNAVRLGYQRGYQEGVDHGRKDGRHHDSFDFAHDRKFRHADSGYKDWYGPKSEYARGYRSGYARGYREAYFGQRRYGYDRQGGRGDGDYGYGDSMGPSGQYDREDDRYNDDYDHDRR
jgi:hypothetical protein